MKTLLLLVGFFVALAPSVSANSVYYYNNDNHFRYSSRQTFNRLLEPNFFEEKEEVKLKVTVQSNDAFVGEYNNQFYTNPTVTPYYYPDNNQKSHLPPNPYNYIY